MPWEQSPPELAERFADVLGRFPDLERRKMFGYPAAFRDGHMVTGLHEARWVARVPADAGRGLPSFDAAQPFEPMAGRPMKGFVVVPPEIVADDAAIDAWIGRAIEHVATLPLKKR
jgi:hypothetical protein